MRASPANERIRYEEDQRCPPLVSIGVGLRGATFALAPLVLVVAITPQAGGQGESYLSWAVFAALIIAGLLTALQATRLSRVGAGHVLIMGPGAGHAEFEAAAKRLATMARRRTARFRTREQLADVLGFVPTYERVVPGRYELFARTTLRESPTGQGYELRCPPEYEAQITDYASVYGVLVEFGTLLCPTKVIGADPTPQYAYLPTLDLSDIVTIDYDFLPETTHFLQLEEPEQCVAAMREFIESSVRS